MFNIGFVELIVVLLEAFLVVGPKDLPRVARWIARQVKAIRRLILEIKRESGWDDIAAEFKETQADITDTLRDADISADLKTAVHAVKQGVDSAKKDIKEKDAV